jgi:hypothetical protein
MEKYTIEMLVQDIHFPVEASVHHRLELRLQKILSRVENILDGRHPRVLLSQVDYSGN